MSPKVPWEIIPVEFAFSSTGQHREHDVIQGMVRLLSIFNAKLKIIFATCQSFYLRKNHHFLTNQVLMT